MSKKVYVIQHPSRNGYVLDLSQAEEFGKLQKACFYTQNIDITKDMDSVVKVIQEYLKDFKDGDSLLQVGEHTLFSAACVIASNYVDDINIIKWDRNKNKVGGYYSKVVVPTCD